MKDIKKRRMKNKSSKEILPLCVDLDGTLIKSDVLIESFFALIKHNVWFVFLIPFWLLRGKAYLKQQIADHVELDVRLLPYHQEFLDYLRQQHKTGRRLILCTASHSKFARQIAEHLGVFNGILASDGRTNLSGSKKLERLRAKFGERRFDYAGNSRADLHIWPYTRRAILVNPEPGIQVAAKRITSIERVFDDRRCGVIKEYLRALRLHQWFKNLLVFVPLFAAHQFGNTSLLLQAVVGFFAFGLCASGVYLLNDLLDLPSDREHPRKRSRPFASGTISIKSGTLMIPVLLLAAFGVAWALPVEFGVVLGMYYALTLTYSLWLKRTVLVDVMVLAGLYTIRIIAGAAAVSIVPSFWLLAFSMFIFLSLAMVKRYSELLELQGSDQQTIKGRGYQVVDLATLNSLGAASGYLAVLVLALYINSEDVKRLYTHVEMIWLLLPLLLFWVSRVWLAAGRGKMHDDPLIFSLKDWVSRWVATLTVVILWLAM